MGVPHPHAVASAEMDTYAWRDTYMVDDALCRG